MMSHHERQELERIEQWFRTEDPNLARSLGDGRPPGGGTGAKVGRFAVDALAAILILMGAFTLNFGLIFLGAVVLVAGACLHVAGRSGREGRSGPLAE
ncbi:DUF3040 domain-containing protein [Qaidamihabitans albus]|uniref:DUF3040 domain-containing protein n=1 Tax=Qaidamihabitans albus TaxID=2795733 RepID=UPI0018F2446C|nr:DUF3040 domain-containing protein [Qaidamihabitans albus]